MSDGARRPPSPFVRMGQLATVLGSLALVALLAYGLTTRAPNGTIDQALADGKPVEAPGFALELLDRGRPPTIIAREVRTPFADRTVDLSELRGLPLALNFWASWCNPCREEAPILERGWEKWGTKGVLFIGLNMQDASPDARAFLDEYDIDYPTIRDQGKTVSVDYGMAGIPETYFIDADGRVVAHSIGVLTPSELDRGVQAAKSGEPIQTFGGGAARVAR